MGLNQVIGRRAKKDILKGSGDMEDNIMKRKILYITGTRADYGLMQSVLREIEKLPNMELEIIATGMHLMEEFGMTVNEIKKDKFRIHEIDATFEGDDKESTANFIGKFIQLLTTKVKEIKPDIILLIGDRAEMLGGAIVGSYMGIPVAHVHGGDVSSTVDEHARHAITKLAHLHFPATKKSASNILKMGEERWRVHTVGSPSLDGMFDGQSAKPEKLERKYGIDSSKQLILAVQHPVSIEYSSAAAQMKETLEALVKLEKQTVLVYPNADAGGRAMISEIRRYEGCSFLKIFKNIPRSDYLGIMRLASAMVGNSSSGIVEAPSFRIPVVNIGTRQEGREKAGNTIDVGYDRGEIVMAMKKALEDKEFRQKVTRYKNPYGNGKAGEKIARILSRIEIDDALLQKSLSYK
jgi:GDP/UDP-N,N'-diacetylbacillosamine 2-epimerase (hydrolysing)